MAKRYTDKIADVICSRLAAGESLNAICKDDGMPAESTVRGWVLDDVNGFAAKYARAREIQAECLFDEILDISDDGRRDYTEDEDGNPVVNHDHINRAKLRVDARKWFLSKVLPKKFGDKVNHEVTGKNGAPVKFCWAESEEPNHASDEMERGRNDG